MALGLLLAARRHGYRVRPAAHDFGFDPLLRGVNFLVAVIGCSDQRNLLTMEERLALRGHAAAISLRSS
jgi:hypothetical protein